MSIEKVKIRCIKNGPARVHGDFEVEFPDGTIKEISGVISLCRCGISEKMPLCDGAHKNCIPKHDDRITTK